MILFVSRLSLAVVVCLTMLAGCTTVGKSVRSITGSPAPAASPFISALDGGIVSRAGVPMSAGDKQRALEAEYRALEAAPGGQPVAWSGRGVSGQVVAAAPYQVGSQNCRQYTHTVTVSGRDVTARGAACRNDDGSWSPLT